MVTSYDLEVDNNKKYNLKTNSCIMFTKCIICKSGYFNPY